MLSRKQLWRKTVVFKEKWNNKFNDNEIIPKKKTSVSFGTTVNVTLIPELQEYMEAELADKLWYNSDDIDLFKRTFIEELKQTKYNTM